MPPVKSSFRDNVRKYIRYVFKNDGFAPRTQRGRISEHAFQTAKTLRGADRPPAIIIHGIMKRSGTVYSGELLSSHPHVYAYPNHIWEIPFLPLTGDILKMRDEFFLAYRQNVGKIEENDFLPIFGASFIAYLYSLVPAGQRMLLKMPGVEYLDYFFDVFPHENLLLLTRDGRDLVASTTKTWTQLRFADVCRRWDRSAKMILRFHEQNAGRSGYWLARFEEAVQQPENFVRQACARFGLDPDVYPFEKINALPVIGSSTTRKQGLDWIEKPKDFNPIGRWQQWSAWQKRTFKRIAGRSLIALGYCEDLDW